MQRGARWQQAGTGRRVVHCATCRSDGLTAIPPAASLPSKHDIAAVHPQASHLWRGSRCLASTRLRICQHAGRCTVTPSRSALAVLVPDHAGRVWTLSAPQKCADRGSGAQQQCGQDFTQTWRTPAFETLTSTLAHPLTTAPLTLSTTLVECKPAVRPARKTQVYISDPSPDARGSKRCFFTFMANSNTPRTSAPARRAVALPPQHWAPGPGRGAPHAAPPRLI